jgi:dipeptidyl aminopeptidase/acylaminoacyl peptidase
LWFVRETTLMSQAFDAQSLEVLGEPTPVADPVRFIPAASCGVFSVSAAGAIVVQPGSSVMGSQMLWRTLEGAEIELVDDIMMQDGPALSPDGRHVAFEAFSASGGTGDIWVHDLQRSVRSRFTFDPAADEDPQWSPDGKRIAFSSARNNMFGIYIKEFGGASNAELFLRTDGLVFVTDWTEDHIVYFASDSTNAGNIMAVPTQGERQPFTVVATPYGEYNGVISKDGRWMAYVSDESGVMECYVTSFPQSHRKWQISNGGAIGPRWDPNDKGMYYMGADGVLYFVEAEWDETSFAIGATRALFEVSNALAYQLSRDGTRILVLEDADSGGSAPLTLISNWQAPKQAR